MPVEVILPKVDMDMESGIITEWKVSAGDRVRQGQILFDIETNKSVMEVESPGSGVIRDLAPITGEPVAVGTVVGWIDADGDARAPPPAPVRRGARNIERRIGAGRSRGARFAADRYHRSQRIRDGARLDPRHPARPSCGAHARP